MAWTVEQKKTTKSRTGEPQVTFSFYDQDRPELKVEPIVIDWEIGMSQNSLDAIADRRLDALKDADTAIALRKADAVYTALSEGVITPTKPTPDPAALDLQAFLDTIEQINVKEIAVSPKVATADPSELTSLYTDLKQQLTKHPEFEIYLSKLNQQ